VNFTTSIGSEFCLLNECFESFKVNPIKFMPSLRVVETKRQDAERLADIFTVLQRCFILNLSKELSRGNVSFPQYCLLGFLREQKELTMSEIAQRMGHSTAAATGLIDRLENLGHVRRTHGRDDRRKVLVQITASGSALVAEVREDMISNLLKMMEVLDPEEQKTWLQIYEKIFSYCQSK
jgi:DNA-binding MarR family transcriptional regulator